MKRVGLFGGSFNPVHHGHLLLGRAVKEALRLDELVYIPCNQSAYKKKLMPAALRLRLLRAALRGVKGFKVSDIEIKRGGVSRSIDTLEALRKKWGESVEFFIIIGEDQAGEFPAWKDALRLSRLSKVCVMARPGFRKSALIHKKYRFRTVNVPQYEISSTEVRRRLHKKLPLTWYLPSNIDKILSKK